MHKNICQYGKTMTIYPNEAPETDMSLAIKGKQKKEKKHTKLLKKERMCRLDTVC